MAVYGRKPYGTDTYGSADPGTWFYNLAVSWNGSPNGENEQALSFTVRRGRDGRLGANGWRFAEPGSLSVTLNNRNNRYSFYNASSPLYGYLLPSREVRLMAGNGTVSFPIFAGRISDLRPQSSQGLCRLDGVDGIEWLRNQRVSNGALQTNCTAADAVKTLIDTADWPYSDTTGWVFPATLGTDSYLGSTAIEDNGDTMPVWWPDPSKTVWEAITDIANAWVGDPYVVADGTFGYKARRAVRQPLYTLTDGDVLKDAEVLQPWDEIRNNIRVTAHPRGTSTAGIEIWRLNDVTEIEAGATVTLYARYAENGTEAPASAVTTPVATTDYTANAQANGGGTNKTAALSVSMNAYAAEAEISITNTDAATVYVTMFKLRGTLRTSYTPSTATASDTDSQVDFGKRAGAIDSIWLQEANEAQYHASYIATLYAEPRLVVRLRVTGDPVRQFAPDLFDVLTLDIDQWGVSGDYEITSIEHEFRSGQCTTTWRLEPTSTEQGGFWVFDADLGETSVLGW